MEGVELYETGQTIIKNKTIASMRVGKWMKEFAIVWMTIWLQIKDSYVLPASTIYL